MEILQGEGCGLRPYTGNRSEHRLFSTALLLVCFGFIGFAGMHRLYTGKIGTGILFFITCGLFGLGTLIDLIVIVTGGFRCKNGEALYR